MAETFELAGGGDYPTIDPTTFDLIISGTGLPASLLAAAAASTGKSVLHVDPNPFYGSHFSSLPLPSLLTFVHSLPSLYSEIQTSGTPPESSRSFLLDLAGPRVLYCADAAVDLMLRSGASHHVEFKSVDSSLIYWEREFLSVPDSRQAIFRDESLDLKEKGQMRRFLKLVQGHIGGEERIEEEDLEIPFVEFLKKQGLSPKIRGFILYAIALADYDQEEGDGCKRLITTKEGVDSIALYISSVGRFPNAVGAFIYPIYGHGELPQAFCRCAAVKGALYVLRMPVVDLTYKENMQYKGVRLASGQEIFSHKLVMEPSYAVPSSVSTSQEGEGLKVSGITKKVARGICISDGSIKKKFSNILVIFPPRSLHSEQLTTVRALQLSSNVAVCPSGMFVVYLSTPCDDTLLGKGYIEAAINVLFALPNSNSSEERSTNNEGEGESKPTLLWSINYVQEFTEVSVYDGICSCAMPDWNLDYRNLLESVTKLFSQMFPGEEFLPQSSDPEIAEDDDGLAE